VGGGTSRYKLSMGQVSRRNRILATCCVNTDVSSVSKVTGYGGSIPAKPRGGDLSLRDNFHTGSGAHPTSCPVGTGDSFHEFNPPEREANHSHQAEVMDVSPALPPYMLIVFKHRHLYLHYVNTNVWNSALGSIVH
jgi:hypothetical protein